MAENKRLKILIDIGHPGHVHLFRPFAQSMQEKGNIVFFTCRQKEFETELLVAAGFKYKSFGKHYKTKVGKIWGLIKFDIKMILTCIKFKPDILLSHGSIYAAHASFLVRKPHISMEDTGNMEQVNLYKPFTKVILTADVFHKNLGDKQIKYAGYHELAYLHPKIFNPERDFFDKLGIEKIEKSVLFRFISWDASHDIGQGGFSLEEKIKIVTELAKKYKVFISSESKLPKEIEKFHLKTPPEKIHTVMSSVSLFIGEGATMASECAMLGTPAIYVNSMDAGTIDDQEKFNLLFHFKNSKHVLEKAHEILQNDNSKEEWIEYRNIMLKQKIDVTSFMVWFIENWPKSFKIMKENPAYQNKFK